MERGRYDPGAPVRPMEEAFADAVGTAIGLAGSIAVARGLSSMLFGVGAADPATFIGVPMILAAVAALACYLPARQARRLDPIKAINAD
jgi:putative ABC transport system permease protein